MRNLNTLFLITLGLGLLTGHAALAQETIGSTAAPGSMLDVKGSVAANYFQVTSAPAATPYAMSATDFYVVYNGTAAGYITLPAANTNTISTTTTNFKGRLYNIKNTTATQTLTVQAAGTETIDGSNTITVPAGQSVQLVSTGATGTTAVTWEIVSFNTATAVGASAADNGLTLGYNSAGRIGLGGTLARNTDVALNTFNQTFSGTGFVGIGTNAPTQELDIVTQNTGADNIHLTSYGTTPSPTLRFRSAQGTLAAPTFLPIAANQGAAFGSWINSAWNGTGFSDLTSIRSLATENHSATGLGANLIFSTTANGTTALVERMRIEHNGNVGIGDATAPNSTLQVVGSVSANIRTVNATVNANDFTVLVNGNIALPDPATATGRVYYLVNNSATTRTVSTTAGAGFRDAGTTANPTTITLTSATGSKAFTVQSDGADWWIISSR